MTRANEHKLQTILIKGLREQLQDLHRENFDLKNCLESLYIGCVKSGNTETAELLMTTYERLDILKYLHISLERDKTELIS